MKTTKKQSKETQPIEKKTIEVTLNDKGVIINKETGKPHFGAIDIDEMKKMVKERNNIEFELILTYDDFAPSLKIQLKELGFKIPKGVLKDAEKIRLHLLALNKIKILSNKQANKCFKKLNIKITKTIMDNAFDKEEIKTMHIKTKNIN